DAVGRGGDGAGRFAPGVPRGDEEDPPPELLARAFGEDEVRDVRRVERAPEDDERRRHALLRRGRELAAVFAAILTALLSLADLLDDALGHLVELILGDAHALHHVEDEAADLLLVLA